MSSLDSIEIRVWGARGTSPMPGPATLEFGGHTCCVEARVEGRVIVFDAGTGIIPLGRTLVDQSITEIDLFLTHAHYDHVLGLPYFDPAYRSRTRLRIWAGHMLDGLTTEQVVAGVFRPPYFPATKSALRAAMEYRQFSPGDVLQPFGNVRLRTAQLVHPNGAVGYRLEAGDCSFAYVTDFEPDGGSGDAAIVELTKGADLALLDATYTPQEYPRFAGFGHATWEACGKLCQRADVRRWGLFHHMHLRTDIEQKDLEAAAMKVYPNAFAARQGQIFRLPAQAEK